MQITLTAPNVLGIGAGGHPGYRAIGGVGVLIEVNGKPYTGNLRHRLTLDHLRVRHLARVTAWAGGTAPAFQFIGATVSGPHRAVSFVGSEADFAVSRADGGAVAVAGRGRGSPDAGSRRRECHGSREQASS